MSTLRVKPGINSVVMLPNGVQIALRTDMAFDSSDPVVADVCKASGCEVDDWFQVDGEAPAPRRKVGAVRVEQAAGLTR